MYRPGRLRDVDLPSVLSAVHSLFAAGMEAGAGRQNNVIYNAHIYNNIM